MVPGRNVYIVPYGSYTTLAVRKGQKKLHLPLFHVAHLFLVEFGKFDFFYEEKSQFETKW